MKTIGLFFMVVVTSLFLSVSSDGQEKKKSGDVYYEVDQMPVFPGGDEALRRYIANNVKYPETAKKNGITGKVFVSFIVDESGAVTDAKVVRAVDPSLDAEAVRVISGMPVWQPGKEKGKAVKVQYTIPIMFALN